jgi:acyl-CoA thioesterase-1
MKIQHLLTSVFFFLLLQEGQAQPIKIAIVGNSITEGNGVNPSRDAYPVQLGLYLGDNYQVGNFGVSGRTMLKKGDYPIWAESLFQDALAFEPDILIILLGTNDSKPQNWDLYGEEFDDDYLAMIDTFSVGGKNPEVWACLPPPAFAVQFSIRDSVIVNEVIPSIEQVIAQRQLKSVDFYMPFIGHNEYFPDAIHPNATGHNIMAKILYEALTGDSIQQLHDRNLVKNKTVQVSTGTNGNGLTDGDQLTAWTLTELPATAIVDIEDPDSADACVLHFPNSPELGLQFTIEGSVNEADWVMLADHSDRMDTDQLAVTDTFTPLSVRYLRLTITGSSQPGSEIQVSEMECLAWQGAHHANAMTVQVDRQSSKYIYYRIYFTPYNNNGEKTLLARDAYDGNGFLQMTGYKSAEENTDYRATVKLGSTYAFYDMSYFNKVEVISDTLYMANLESAIRQDNLKPRMTTLSNNYPNPFNPETTIQYTLSEASHTVVSIYNERGQKIAVLVNQVQPAGHHSTVFNAAGMPSGLYVVELKTNDGMYRNKIMLIK